jgi:putative serine protease PepD
MAEGARIGWLPGRRRGEDPGRHLGGEGVVARIRVAVLFAATALAVGLSACGEESEQPVPAVEVAKPVEAFEDQLVRVVESVSPSVVQIQTSSGLGSGVVYDRDGNIVTNAHVVAGGANLTVALPDGVHEAKIVGTFQVSDLAVVRVEGGKLRPASFADSSKIEVGDVALAIGNPLGLRSSVTEGIVSSLGRTVSAGNGVTIASAIQTSAPINPGNSGGALVDLSGRVIGIPTLAPLVPELGGAQAPGIGFAIPSNTVRKIADQLIEHGRVIRSGRAFLDVRVSSIVGGGVLVNAVEHGGPAARAGIRPGDIIVSVANRPTPTSDVLSSVLANLRPGQRVPVKILRPDGSRVTSTVRLGEVRG